MTLREVGLSYDDYVLDQDGLSKAHRRLLKTAASVLSKVAAVEGKNSFEWSRAEEILVSLSDDRISLSRSRHLLEKEGGGDISRTGLDEEQCLVLIRVAIDVAIADGFISDAEIKAIEGIASSLNLDRSIVRMLINMLTGEGGDVSSRQDHEKASRVLGVSPTATVGEIRSAYKRLMMLHHPDLTEPDKRDEANQKAAEINAAYDLLIGRSKASSSQTTSSSTRNSQNRREQSRANSQPPPPPKPKKTLCVACERRISPSAKFCGFCGTKN